MTEQEKREKVINGLECCVFDIPCEFATSLGYCQFMSCVKVRPEVKRNG